MKKLLTMAAASILATGLFAGGLVTNTNQSAMFTRMQARDATLGADAVYYNPAGLAMLADGFYISFSNQSIFQTQTITSDYSLLSGAPREYIGDVKAPLFPSFYYTYKTGKLAFSFGFNPIGGGGGATFEKGLPSFETGIADLVPTVQSIVGPVDQGVALATETDPLLRNITSYASDIYFKGSSIYFGYQANVSYAITDMLSVAVGARLVTAKNTYEGYIQDVTITSASIAPTFAGTYSPGDYLRKVAASPYVTNPVSQATINGYAAAIDAGANVEADVEQTGTGVTPVISLNFAPSDKINVAVKYEMKTKLELTNAVVEGKGAGIWEDGETEIADMPAQLAIGLTLKPLDNLLISTGAHYYFDKNVDYDGSEDVDVEMIDNNFIEYALGLEYGISEKLRVSAGWLTTITGVNENYQSDLSYSLKTNSFGGGFGIDLIPMLELNLAGSYTIYKDGSLDKASSVTTLPYTMGLDKKVFIISAGLNFSFGM